MDLWIIRAILFAAILVSGYLVRPFHLDASFTLALSAALGLLIVLVENVASMELVPIRSVSELSEVIFVD